MEIVPAGRRAYAVHITSGDPEYSAVSSGRKEDSDAVLSRILTLLRVPPSRGASAELFPGEEEALLFLTLEEEVSFFPFPDLESLLAALPRFSGAADSRLYDKEGRYILAVFGGAACARSELENLSGLPQEYLLHLEEHGRCLMDSRAVQRLASVFAPQPY